MKVPQHLLLYLTALRQNVQTRYGAGEYEQTDLDPTIMTIDDKVTRGFLAGVLAGLVQSSIAIPLYRAKKIRLRWLDFASVIIFGARPQKSLSQEVASEVATEIWSGLLGAVYTFVLPRIGERNHRFKGMLYGVTSWFSIYAVTHLMDVSRLMKIDKNTAMTHGAIAVLWGLIVDESVSRMERASDHTISFEDVIDQTKSVLGTQ